MSGRAVHGVFAPLFVALALMSAAATDAVAAPPDALEFGACGSNQVIVPAAGVQCAKLDVPFDRADPAVGTLALAVQRVPASSPRTGVLVLLAGGPGQPALPPFESFLAPLAKDAALAGFELVSFDQRGTGQSEGLVCPENSSSPLAFLRALLRGPGAFLGECGSALGPTRAFYSSQESVDDLNSLRIALGGVPLSLLGVSYGTRIAGMYAREYPKGIARLVLDSAVPVGGSDALDTQRMRALRRVLDEGICGAGDCRSFSSDVYADLIRVLARLRRRPLSTRIYNPRGKLVHARISERAVLRMVLRLDLSPGARLLAPAALAAAAHGDGAPLARLTGAGLREAIGGRLRFPRVEIPFPAPTVRPAHPRQTFDGGLAGPRAPEGDSEISLALFAATFCTENELPWRADSAPGGRPAALRRWLASLPRGATMPFATSTVAATSAVSLCVDWPATAPAPPPPSGISATPTLILSGDDDLRTPYEQDLAIAATYSDATLLRVAGAGHSTVSEDVTGCARDAMIDFVSTGAAPASCPGSREPRAIALPPASLREVAPAASRSRLAGRVAAAAALTLEDVIAQEVPFGGGLRGGYWDPAREGLVLHRVTDIPGVALSGNVREGEAALSLQGTLAVSGRLEGRLVLRGRVLSGRVGGARVRASIGAL